jgi:glycosyltransferase involved in cell wall biosynthesis
MPLVSVIIPTHRRPVLLQAAILSVLNQTFQDFEIVVVDDASGDNTEEVVRSFGEPRIRYIAHKTNWRVAAARNTGMLNSGSPLIAFLDDDDEWLPAKLERQVELLGQCAFLTGVVYTGFQKVDRTSGELLSKVVPTKRGHILHELCRNNCVGTASTVVLRRECLDEVGLFDETIEFGEEYEMWIRIAHAFDFAYLPEPLVRYSVHSTRLSTNYGVMVRGLERQLQKHGAFFASYPSDLARRYIELGAMLCYERDGRRGRRAFWQAVRIAPLRLKNYFYLGLGLFGARIFRQVRLRLLQDRQG